MVLPASPAAHAPAEAAHGVLARLQLILRLAATGVLVLVDDAHPEQLGTFVRMLLTIAPNLEVLTRALDLLQVPDGSVVVLVPNAADATWLNQERPIFSQKRLRVLLFSDSNTSKVLAQKAPDFFHWISHRMEAPQGAWPPAVFGLRVAAAKKVNVTWQGGDFAAVFADAFPGQSYAIHSAATTYDELVELMQHEQRTLVLKDVDGLFRLRRIRWALAESARKEMVVLDQPAISSAEFWGLHAKPYKLDAAIHELKAAGAKHPGRLAALLHFEAETINVAMQLFQLGVSEETITALALENEDAGTGIIRSAIENKIDVDSADPPMERANEQESAITDIIPLNEEHFMEAASAAYMDGDPEIALRWARTALERNTNSINALMTFASISMAQARYDDAEQAIQRALILQEKQQDNKLLRMQLLMEMASLQQRIGQLHAARRTIEKALRLQKRLDGPEAKIDHAHALTVLGRIMDQQGDLRGAEQALRKAHEIKSKAGNHDPRILAESLLDLARVLCERNELDEAKSAIEKALEVYQSLYGREHPRVATCLQELARVYLLQREFMQANQALEEAIRIHQKLGSEVDTSNHATALHRLGSSRTHLGDFDGAIDAFEKSIQLKRQLFGTESHPDIANSLHELGLVEFARGNLDKARNYFSKTLEIERRLYKDPNHYQIAVTQSNLGMILALTGKRDAGLELIRSAHQVLLAKLGPDHPATQDAAEKLQRFS